MEYLPEDPLLKFHPDTLHYVRKTYKLDHAESMAKAIDTLDAWVKKQDHFIKKDYNRDYLERTIIRAEGSVEYAKEHLEKLCKSRKLVPRFFLTGDFGTPLLADKEDVFLPKLTKDYYRVYLAQNKIQDYKPEMNDAYYKRLIYMLEYICAHDYSCGFIWVYDFRQTNMSQFLKYLDKTDLGHCFNIILNAYSFKLKGIHIITTSNLVDTFVSMLKEVVNKEVRERIHVLKDVEELYDHVDRHILPEEYDGQETSMSELYHKWVDILGSKDYNKYMEDMNKAKTKD
ncbi:unnamed protein product [Diatraea saccharalis]|uniref:CRAL-TRIO domain-containing protein n=1 Tax=Diatraea saccharalis TaxID=40085 RepID=A0A9N9R714_9NEOP|nr:unnamed protein product [Diatraea saccharalis]